ncbi:MAG TPA: O-antigen ligase family protein [Thermoanaerobaculia bacterium]|nr:O-antigen ligase family protein [Thermoanaerobaculia bacterium]
MRTAALRVLQIGAIAAVLVVSTQTVFDLDRFLVPKELVLHATALVAALLGFGALRRLTFTRGDWLLALYLLLSAISAALATNRWLGFRAFALSASAVLIFWTARVLGDVRLINALALAVVIASIASLAETYGLRLIFFASTRVPGGTLGNRNFVAHLAAIGLPLLFSVAVRGGKFLMPSIGVAIVTASLVLTRSRAAWIAAVVMLVVYVIFSRAWARIALVLAFAVAGAVAALVIPNTLQWRSGNPYMRSVTDIANYEQGSGRGRLVQYGRSLAMAAHHPLFGVGPGNWPVVYPHFAQRNDPSVDGSDNMTFNPWPSSDWIAFVSERGAVAAVVLAIALIVLAWKSRDAAAMAIVAAALVAGLFDAVLLLPVPAFILFAALGAWSGDLQASDGGRKPAAPLLLILIAAAGVYRSGAEVVAMSLYDEPRVAAKIDPGNYRIQRRVHARAARALFPYAR